MANSEWDNATPIKTSQSDWDSATPFTDKSDLSRSAIISHNVDSDKYAANRKAMTDKGIPAAFALPANKPPSMDGMLSTIKDFLGLTGKTAEHFTDPEFAKVAKNDHPALTKMEDVFHGFVDRIRGGFESDMNLLTSIPAAIGGAATGLTTLALTKGDTEAAKAVQEGVSDFLTYHPRTERGQKNVEGIAPVLNFPGAVGHELSEEVAQQWNAPEWLRYIFNMAGEFGGYALADMAVRGAGAHIQNIVDTAKEIKSKKDPLVRDYFNDVAGDSTVQAPLTVVDDILTKAQTTPEEALSDPTAYYEQKFESMTSDTPVKADLPMPDVATLSDHITPEHIKDMSLEGVPSVNEAEELKKTQQSEASQEGGAKSDTLRPAIKDGAEIKTGETGQRHDDIVKNAPEENRGFVTPDGKFIGREEASKWLQENKPDQFEALTPEAKKSLHSEDLAGKQPWQIEYEKAKSYMPNYPENYEKAIKNMSTQTLKDLLNNGYNKEAVVENLARRYEELSNEEKNTPYSEWLKQKETPPKVGNKAQEGKGTGLSAEMKGADETEPLKTTGIKNAETNADLAARGDKRAWSRSPVEEELRRGDQEVFDKAEQKMKDEPSYGKSLAEDIANKPRALTAEEVHALTIHKMRLMNEETRLLSEKNAAEKAGDTAQVEQLGKQLESVTNDLNAVYEASRLSGYESGLGFRARQMMIKEDYSLARTLARMKEKNKGKDITPEQTKQIEELTRQLNDATKKLSDYEESASKKQAEKQVNKIKRDVDASDRKAKRKETKEALDAKFEDLSVQLKKVVGGISANPFVNPKATALVAKMAENRIRSGIVDVDALVDNIHEKVKDVMEGVTKRDVRDAISGYGKTGTMTKDNVTAAIAEAKKQMKLISALEDATAGKEPFKKVTEKTLISDQVKELQKKVKQAMKDSGLREEKAPKEKQPRTSEQIEASRLKAYKTRLTNRIAEMENQLETGNFKKEKRAAIELDQEAMDLKEKQERLKTDIENEIRKQEEANKTWPEKTRDLVIKARRFVLLAGVKVLGKLTTMAASRFITTPMESAMGSILEMLPPLKKIGAGAPREGGGLKVSAEVAGLRQIWQKGTWEDAKKLWKTGEGSWDVLYGDRKYSGSPELLNSMGRLHSIFKIAPKRAEIYRSMDIIGDWYQKQGFDLNDPKVQFEIAQHSYNEGNRAILMNDNLMVSSFNQILNSLKNNKRKDVASRAGAKTAAFALEMEFPIVKVATNFVNEAASYTAGTLKAIPGLTKAAIKGIDSLSPMEKDTIMRNLKKNSLAALLATGVFSGLIPIEMGGYYQKGEKRDSNKLGPGEMSIGGVKVPLFMGHVPIFEALQVYQTVKDASEMAHYKGEGPIASKVAGIGQAATGLAEHIPFVGTPQRMDLSTSEGRQEWFAQLASSLIIPPDIGALAKYTDNDTPRKPSTVKEAFENVIPGMRKDVPLNTSKIHREIIGNLRHNKPLNSYQQKVYDEATKAQQDEMEKKSQMTSRQEAFSNMPVEKMKKAWKVLTPKEKNELQDIYDKKIDNAENKE